MSEYSEIGTASDCDLGVTSLSEKLESELPSGAIPIASEETFEELSSDESVSSSTVNATESSEPVLTESTESVQPIEPSTSFSDRIKKFLPHKLSEEAISTSSSRLNTPEESDGRHPGDLSDSLSNRIKKLLPQRSSGEIANTSPLFLKLQEANQRLWHSLHSQPDIVQKDVQSTTKRIGLRLDKTQLLAVDNSNQIRSSIQHLRTCRNLVDNVIENSKTFLPMISD